MNLTKVMMDGSIIVDSFNVFAGIAGINTLHDVSCILEASPRPSHPRGTIHQMEGGVEGGGDRLSTPIFSVRVVATPRTPSSVRNTSDHQHRGTSPSSAALDISHDPHSDFEIVRVHSSDSDPSLRVHSSFGFDPSLRVHSSRGYDPAVRRMPYAYRPVPPEGSLWGEFCESHAVPLIEEETAPHTSSMYDHPSSSSKGVEQMESEGEGEEDDSSSALAFPSIDIDIKSLVMGLQYSSVDSNADALISSRRRFPKMDDRSGLYPVSPRTKNALSSLQQCFDRSRGRKGAPHPSIAREARKMSPGESKPPRSSSSNASKAIVTVSPVPPPSPPPPTPSSKGLYIIAQNIQKIASAQSSRGADERSST